MRSKGSSRAADDRPAQEVEAGSDLPAAAEAGRRRLQALSQSWREIALPYTGPAPEPQAGFRWIEDGGRSR